VSGAADWSGVLGGIGDEAAGDLAGQIAVQLELGWRHLELRTVAGVALADLTAPGRAELVDAVATAGLSVPCLDSRIGGWARSVTTPFDDDLHELDVLAGLAHALGTRYVRVMSYPNDGLSEPDWRAEVLRRFGVLARRAERLGVVLLIENCSGWAGTSAERVAEILDVAASPALRLLFDIGNPVAHGYDGLAYLGELVRWVEHVHVKDALAPGGGADTVFTAPGRGEARLVECIQMLYAKGYGGVLAVEPHVAVQPHLGRRATPAEVRASYVDYCGELVALLAGVSVVAGGGR